MASAFWGAWSRSKKEWPVKRKIIQVTDVPETDQYYPRILALCDDGSLWVAPQASGSFLEIKWIRVPGVPQDEDADDAH